MIEMKCSHKRNEELFMKNINLPMQVKTYFNYLLFNGYRWSMLITAYALIAVIIVMSSDYCFSEGVYAAEVAYVVEAYDFTGKEKSSSLDIAETQERKRQGKEAVMQAETLSVMAIQENHAIYLNTSSKREKNSQINVNILDSVINDASSVTEESVIEENVTEEKEAFQATGGSTGKIKLSSSEKEVLMRIVEAEATGEDIKGKMLVANVVLNRVNNPRFPDTVEEVVFQKTGSLYQFSPIKDGRYYKVSISSETKKAVNRVLDGEDESKGALYFMARSRAKASNVTWFDRALTRIFQYGSHEFYK